MAKDTSTFIQETIEKEGWLSAVVEKEGGDEKEHAQLLATAALTRGTLDTIPVPEGLEERSRLNAVAHLVQQQDDQAQAPQEKPWLERLGNTVRHMLGGDRDQS